MATAEEFQRHKRRRDAAWSKRGPWDRIYQDVYDYAIPHRRPGGVGKRKNPVDRIFDMTATMSAMQFAGSLQQNLFPSGTASFILESGPIAKLRLGAEAAKLDRVLESLRDSMTPFFTTGQWDTAVHETCIDLSVGTGAIIPIKGNAQDPVVFVSIPFDEIAIGTDGYGRMNFVSWRQRMEGYAILDAFPTGNFSDELKKSNSWMANEQTIYQDFWKDPAGFGWHFGVSLDNQTEFAARDRYRTQPIAVPRYYRVPGEAYGRGPVLLALPSIKTLNKAQELALKSAAIQMLGIWGYRAGGTFNPDTVRVGPGEMWPMQSTGGVLGPDVSRIDPATGRMDVAQMVIGNLRDDIKAALFDTRLPDSKGTPRSASEIVERIRQRAETHIGAYGRLSNEIMPVIVPRVAEILHDVGFLPNPLAIDQLLVALSVQSPMSAALAAERLTGTANYVEMVQAVAGPDNVGAYAKIDKVLEHIGTGLNIRKDIIPTKEERDQFLAEKQQAQVAGLLAQGAADAAPKVIEGALAE